MASSTRILLRLPVRTSPFNSSLKSIASRNSRQALPRQTFQSTYRRSYASAPETKSSKTGLYIALGLALAGGAGGYFYLNNGSVSTLKSGSSGESRGAITPKKDDYQKVYNEIAKLLEEKDDYDDGSYGPVIVRLAWHCSGTYDKATGTGGSNGATMRFAPEGDHGANAGLKAARDFLQPVKGMLPFKAIPLLLLRQPSSHFHSREVSLDNLLGPLDSCWCLFNSRNARPSHPLAPWSY